MRDAERRETVIDQGCRFRPRCPFAMDICVTHPQDLAAAPGHLARCWLYGEAAGSVSSAGAGEIREV
jgi:peptide/nickel transport system ATP-binding protein